MLTSGNPSEAEGT